MLKAIGVLVISGSIAAGVWLATSAADRSDRSGSTSVVLAENASPTTSPARDASEPVEPDSDPTTPTAAESATDLSDSAEGEDEGSPSTNTPASEETTPGDGGDSGEDDSDLSIASAEPDPSEDPPPAEMLEIFSPPEPEEGYGPVENQVEDLGGFGLTADYRGYDKDSDFDGLSDGEEQDLIEWFKPLLVYDEEEAACQDPRTKMAPIFQVSPTGTDSDGAITSAVITFVAAYQRDCGLYGLKWEFLQDHPGDTEAMWIYLTRNGSEWAIDHLEIKRHFDPIQSYSPNRLSYYTDDGGVHPVIWVSESKHAAFTSADECEWYAPENLPESVILDILQVGGWLPWVEWSANKVAYIEDCGGGPTFLPHTPFEANVGEQDFGSVRRQAFDSIADSDAPLLRSLFHGEYAWTDVEFCALGELGFTESKCAGALAGKWKTGIQYVPSIEPTTVSADDGVTATIHQIWLEFDVTEFGDQGMRIHVAFSVESGYRALEMHILGLIRGGDGTYTYSGTNAAYHTDTGQLAVLGTAVTNPDAQVWGQADYALFLPYEEFFPGEQSYYAEIRIEGADGTSMGETATSFSGGFTVTRSDALTGDWNYSVGDDCCHSMTVSSTIDPNTYTYTDASGASGQLTIWRYDVTLLDGTGSYVTSGTITHVDEFGWPSRIEMAGQSIAMWR